MATLRVMCSNETRSGEKKYFDENAVDDVISYVQRPDKTPHHLVNGYGVYLPQAAHEMNEIARIFGKQSGLHLRHFVVSFSENEIRIFRKHTYEMLYHIAQYAAAYYGHEYQIIFAVHEDAKHPHIHFVMNTVNFNTGKKYRGDKKDYYNFLTYLGSFLQEQYGFILTPVKDGKNHTPYFI